MKISSDESYSDPNQITVRTIGTLPMEEVSYIPSQFLGTWTLGDSGEYFLDEKTFPDTHK